MDNSLNWQNIYDFLSKELPIDPITDIESYKEISNKCDANTLKTLIKLRSNFRNTFSEGTEGLQGHRIQALNQITKTLVDKHHTDSFSSDEFIEEIRNTLLSR